MQVHNVHSREIGATAQTVGHLLDELGDGGGRIWPVDRWPADPMAFDRRLEVGSRGGHGTLTYTVESHVPGRSVVFRFTPETSLDGIHRLDVRDLGPRRSRLTHTLDVRVRGSLRLARPVLLGFHNAMVEDLLARADHVATGGPLVYPRAPRWVRALNAVGSARSRRASAATTAGP
jgi:hypothetical protein